MAVYQYCASSDLRFFIDRRLHCRPARTQACQGMAHKHTTVRLNGRFFRCQELMLQLRVPQPKLFSNPLLFLGLLTVPFDRAAKEGFASTQQFVIKGSGYTHEQSTKPQTLGYGLADSPVGLLAWIYEKLVGWTDDYPWTDDEGGSRDTSALPFDADLTR